MTVGDLNLIKAEAMATDAADTCLGFIDSMVWDMNGNNVTSGSALGADSFLDDLMRPHLLSYHFNVNIRVLTLQFSEMVLPGSVLMTPFALQNIADNSSIGPLSHSKFNG